MTVSLKISPGGFKGGHFLYNIFLKSFGFRVVFRSCKREMYIFQIHDAMWLLVLKLCSFKLLWIFLFVVFCITAFLMVMHNCDKDELKKCILYDDWSLQKLSSVKKHESVGEKLQLLADNLSKKEHALKQSQLQVTNAAKVLNSIDNVNPDLIRDRYKSLLADLKKDLRRTEKEVTILQSEVGSLSKRRENLKNDLLSQQTDYQRMLDAFGKELEGTNQMSRTHGH